MEQGAPPKLVPVVGVFGLVSALCTLVVCTMGLIQPALLLPAGGERLLAEGVISGVITGELALFIFISVIGIGASVGLIAGRRWGWKLSLGWCFAMLGFEALGTLAAAIAVGHYSTALEVDLGHVLGGAMVVPLGGCCGTVFALVALIVLLHTSVRAWARA